MLKPFLRYAFWGAVVFISFLLFVPPYLSASAPGAPSDPLASFEVTILIDRLREPQIPIASVEDKIVEVLDRKRFRLSELQNAEIVSGEDRHKLSELTQIDIVFYPAP